MGAPSRTWPRSGALTTDHSPIAAMYLGAWWVPFPVGLLLGLLVPRARFSIPAGAAVGFVAWTVPLVGEQVQYGLRPAASSIAAIMGLTGAADLPVALTILVGTLLGASGAWLGSAGRALAPRGAKPEVGRSRASEPSLEPASDRA